MSSSGSRHQLTRQEKRDRRLTAIISKTMAKAVSEVYENANKSPEGSQAEAPKDSSKTAFSFKQFKACGPKEFTGEDGPTAMFHWFDSIEVTLRQSRCPENLRTLNTTGVFQSRALDWWTTERNKRGNDAAYELTWEELKANMIDEFCPPHERQKLEDEFWGIKQKDGDNAALTARFKQLSIICPDQVKTPKKAIKKYIRALPDCVADFVHASKPATIEETYLLAAEINDKRVKAGFWDKQVYNNYTAQCGYGPRQDPVQAVVNQALLPAPQGQPAAQAPVVNARDCFACGDPNHFANRCPKRVVKQEPQQPQQQQQQQPQQQQQAARARTFNINVNQAQADNNVVNGTFLVNGLYASCLFDTGADNCFVSFEFEKLLSRKRSYISSSFEVEVANGKSIAVNSVLRDCTLELNNHIFPINLIPMQLGSVDVIVGMDFLRENHAEVACFDKMIRFSLANGDQLCVYGETTSKGLKLMSCLQANKYLRKEYQALLAIIVVAKKEKKRKVEVKDIPVVREFPQVFPDDLPGLPPSCDIDFRIDLIPGANPVAKAPYRLAPSKCGSYRTNSRNYLKKALFARALLLGAHQSFLSKRRMGRFGCASIIGS
ncbi:putative transcription factor interactor and regulator CCHC(Zn) family [Helianthus anomalus]